MSRIKTIIPRQTLAVGYHTTAAITTKSDDNVSVQLIWEGSPVAVTTVETSNDPRALTLPDEASWFTEDVTLASGIDGNSADTNLMLHLGNVGSAYVRLLLVVTTAGTISAYATSKDQ